MPQNTQITKLSQAMRKGAKKTYQVQQKYVAAKNDEGKFGACALGAAAIALGLNPKEAIGDDGYKPVYDTIKEQLGLDFEILTWEAAPKATYPERSRYAGEEGRVSSIIIDLNDYDNWGVKEIAAWLEGLGY